ncbi:prepilin peptidase [Saccharothrix coeruleofusca]|uniref:Prepilin type IV endopeptidase peptidase domain-containing protein n=1 Tax=Saccharothrix coeruleofusca TaxID=33919 RepID=A0A918EFP2_9PSEU|nr:A24 family peptidase [Saccharothrix coeruleofusca]GGP62680.1 hypothetical protein GCM10010185_38930 [Saccharothrix coeruleofusca]
MVIALALTGFLAGALGARVLRRLRRGADAHWLWCALLTALLWSLAGALDLPPRWLPVPLALAWVGVALAVVDLRHRRLPDALTLPAYPVAALLLVWSGADLGRALAGCALFGGFHLLVHLLRPSALGGGDAKLAGVLGAVLGAVSWTALPLAALGAAATTLVLARCRRSRHPPADLPHGPGLLASTWLLTVT